MCDDWNDLIEFIIQKSVRHFQKCVRLDTEKSLSSPDKPLETSASVSCLVETLPKHSAEIKIEKFVDRNDSSFQVPHTDIESLLIQLKDSGEFQFHMFTPKNLILNFFVFYYRISETTGLDSVFIIVGLCSPSGCRRRPRIPQPNRFPEFSNEFVLPGGSVDGSGRNRPAFRTLPLSPTSYWSHPSFPSGCPVPAYPA